MNGYDMAMAPLEAWMLRDIRAEIIPLARGDVLEAGMGTGVNLAYYDLSRVRSLTGIDIECPPVLRQRAENFFALVRGSVEALPFAANSFDSVVSTLLFCTVNAARGLREIQRVLKPGGTFVFMEHVRPEGPLAAKAAEAVNRVWSRIANGCNLTRRTDDIFRQSGFADMTVKRSGGVFRYGHATNRAAV